jgi:hypothetical protein
MAGSPVPLARSKTRMPGRGCAYSTSDSVTALPIAADFAFHLSVAIRRYWLPHSGSSLEEVVITNECERPDGYDFLRRVAEAVRLRGDSFVLDFIFGVLVVFVLGAAFAFIFGVKSEGSRRLAVFHRRSKS